MVHKFYYARGGADVAMFQTKALLEKHGHAVIPFSMHHPLNKDTDYSEYFVSYLDFSGRNKGFKKACKLFNRMVYSLEAKAKISKLIDLEKPNIAHLHNIYHQISPSILPALKRRGIPIVMTTHDYKLICPSMLFLRGDGKLECDMCKGKYFFHAIQYRCVKHSRAASLACALEMYIHRFAGLYSLVDIWISPSAYYANKLIAYGLVPKHKVVVLPNFVEMFDSSPLNPNAPMVCIGKLVPEKGLFTLLEAFYKLKTLSLVIVGDGPIRNELEHYIRIHNMSNVTFKGFVENSQIKEILADASALVLPSLQQENAPITILEAYTAGRPVIVSRVGGNPEFVKEGVVGYLFKPGDVDELVSKIRLLYQSKSQIVQMGKNARELVERKYNPEIHYERLLNVYKMALKKHGKDVNRLSL